MKRESGGEGTPVPLKEGVRAGILDAIRRDAELRGGRTARLLAAAALVGVAGSVGITLLVSGHPFDHHPPWHVVAFSAVWAGLLIASLSLVFLRVRTPSLPLGRAASVGLVGLGLAGVCGAACPDQHFLVWWSSTAVGSTLAASGGLGLSALCFGLAGSLGVAMAAAFLVLPGCQLSPRWVYLPAAMLFALLLPGVVLQCHGTAWSVCASWVFGTALGSVLGVAAGLRLRMLVPSA
jgi:hypothetical protein